MKFRIIVIIALCSCATPKMNTGTSPVKAATRNTPRLPVMLVFHLVPEDLQNLFRTQVIARGIDTIDINEGIKTMTFENRLSAKCNMLRMEAIGNVENISQISWRGFPWMLGKHPDTTTRYFNTPDSLRSQPAKAITACLDVILQSRILE